MRYLALACDYDGTLAHHGRVDDATLAALERLLATGRKLILVTGRELHELLEIFPQIHLFERVVVENGALLYRPGSREEKSLGERPPDRFVELLRQRGVGPISVGRVIVATWEPHETAVLEVIRDLGLELQVIFNKGAVMVLPAGVNKATGLAAALCEMGLSPHNVVGVGDAENDHAFLGFCECSVAVANALPTLKEKVDLVTRADHGAGVTELIGGLVEHDLQDLETRLGRHHLLVGTRPDGPEVRISPYRINLLLAGTSGSGKSTVACGLLERLVEQKYQFCVIDPEGDYETFTGSVCLGGPQRAPTIEEVLQLLHNPDANAVVNLVGLPISDRPSFFLALLPRLQELRARTGRPHWIVLDEAHHLLPSAWEPGALAVPPDIDRLVQITVHPGMIAAAALAAVNTLVVVGGSPAEMFREFCAALDREPPPVAREPLPPGEALFWQPNSAAPPCRLRIAPSRSEHRRHSRKYAEGELPPDRSFFFRGPEGKLNLRAQNLILFLQMAEGVDDATWEHHRRHGDYSRWFREAIKDEDLAAEAARIEGLDGLPAGESRALIKAAVERHYTLPASPPLPIPGTDAAPTKAGMRDVVRA